MANLQKTIKLTVSSDGVTDSGVVWDGYAASSTLYTTPINLRNVDRWSSLLIVPSTGSPSGTLSFQVSNDLGRYENTSGPGCECDPSVANWFSKYLFNPATGTWVNSATISNATNILLEELNCSYRWIRFLYTETSGTMTPTSWHLIIKGLTI